MRGNWVGLQRNCTLGLRWRQLIDTIFWQVFCYSIRHFILIQDHTDARFMSFVEKSWTLHGDVPHVHLIVSTY